LIITPLGIALALKMIPSEVMTEARQQSEELMQQGKPISRAGAILVIGVWLVILAIMVWWIVRVVNNR
jgi:hypothetical protein